MKKMILLLVLFIIGCKSYNDYKNENPSSPDMVNAYFKTY